MGSALTILFMDNETLERRFYSVLGNVLGHSDSDLEPFKRLEELGADRRDPILIIVDLEAEFRISIPDDEDSEGNFVRFAINETFTVTQCLDLVKQRIVESTCPHCGELEAYCSCEEPAAYGFTH